MSRSPQQPTFRQVTSRIQQTRYSYFPSTNRLILLVAFLMTSQTEYPAINSYDDNLLVRISGSRREQPADNTCRPVFDPVRDSARVFTPLVMTLVEPLVQPLPSTPLSLIQQFIPISLVEKWVRYTNEAPSPGPEGPPQQHSRQLDWKPTTISEIYLWLAYLIYIGIHRESRYSSHWEAPKPGQQLPSHPIIKFMPKDRFWQLQRRIRICPHNSPVSTLPKPYSYLDEWSEIIQNVSTSLCYLGTDITVDECIQGYTGRSSQTTTVPNKPTPTGFKIWVLGQRGYFHRWIWHTPGQDYGPVGVVAPQAARARKRKRTEPAALNPTQSVVVALVNTLPKGIYHVFLDNLFTSADLCRALRERGHGTTGTCRRNCGLFEPFVRAKVDDTAGKNLWHWGRLRSVPTTDSLVRVIPT
jgi:hypothetical protein